MPKEDISFLFHLDLHLTRRAKDNEKFARPRILICRNPVLKVLKFFLKVLNFSQIFLPWNFVTGIFRIFGIYSLFFLKGYIFLRKGNYQGNFLFIRDEGLRK